jgi:hypothetical protein
VTYEGTVDVYSAAATGGWPATPTGSVSLNGSPGVPAWPTALIRGGGRIGVRVYQTTSTVEFDNFGGGSMK